GTDPPPERAGPQWPPRRALARLAARRPRPPRRTGGRRPGPRRPRPRAEPRPRDPAPEGELTRPVRPEPSTSAQVAWARRRRLCRPSPQSRSLRRRSGGELADGEVPRKSLDDWRALAEKEAAGGVSKLTWRTPEGIDVE